jgi:hypothetical protein
MNHDETRAMLSKDVDALRAKAAVYRSLHLYEAAEYARKLASNIELALTTMPKEGDPKID